MEQYKPYFYANLVSLLDYADCGCVILDEPARTSEHLRSFLSDFQESYQSLLEKGRLLPGAPKTIMIGRVLSAAPAAITLSIWQLFLNVLRG